MPGINERRGCLPLPTILQRVKERILSPHEILERGVRVAADSGAAEILREIGFPYPKSAF